MKPTGDRLVDQLQTETTAAEPKLEQLLAFARDIMLSRPAELKDGDNHQYLIQNGWQARGEDKELRVEIPPELPGIDISVDSAQAIEQFGRDMLDEAFECLGQRGEQLYDEYLRIEADDTDAKINICKELLNVILEISNQATFDTTEEDVETKQYSPFRISPKIIGQHPNTNVNPTCLGKSILATSFFYKLGLPILHAGLVVSRNDSSLMSQGVAMKNVITAAQDVSVSPNYLATLNDELRAHIEEVYRHDGFHATSYVQLSDEAWVQIDPNLQSNLAIKADIREQLTDTYKELTDSREKGSFGNERTLLLDTDSSIVIPLIARTLREIIPTPDELELQLADVPVKQLIKKLLDKISDIFLNFDPETDHLSPMERMGLDQTLDTIAGTSKEAWLEIHVLTALNKVFIDAENYYEDPFMTEAFERVKTDEHYRKRRAADLYLVPFNVLLNIQSTYMLTPSSKAVPHSVVSAGLPEYRIGMSVLSDVAAHYEDELPLSSWLSYWPSLVSLVEHRDQLTSDAQKQLARKAISFFANKRNNLTPHSSTDIIESVLTTIDLKDAIDSVITARDLKGE